MDKYFWVETIACTPNPQQTCWLAMHQDYSSNPVFHTIDKIPDENKAGRLLVDKCLKYNHWGVTEHPQITFNCAGFPHETVMQLRTHRVGISFDVQSQRYTSQGVLDVAKGVKPFEQVFYLRHPGFYTDRQGEKYEYTYERWNKHYLLAMNAIKQYAIDIEDGMSEEHARGLLPQCIRQHFVLSLNARSLMHILDVRSTQDVQLETREFSEILFQRFVQWMPEVAMYYAEKRLSKNKLAP